MGALGGGAGGWVGKIGGWGRWVGALGGGAGGWVHGGGAGGCMEVGQVGRCMGGRVSLGVVN